MLVFGNHGSLNLQGIEGIQPGHVFQEDYQICWRANNPLGIHCFLCEQLKKSLSSVQINGGETLNVQHNKSFASVQKNRGETVNVGVEVANSEVEYIESENLSDLEDVDTCLKKLLPGLDSKDWILVGETLNNVRRLSVFHNEGMHSMLVLRELKHMELTN
ncbi:hypothetical protein ERO13_D08G126380v2 [Gossypium hirsutum]|uniref:Uncharacterized protein n=1 Tax=Gossypium barbadense TaxID=3634 RepID=A0A5J5QDR6_GOSBA|nr:hypothetical protein ES319_D08G135100v1 [Gossypium barbadense]KAG4134003.1 hypothetical protein ERO13_D08G126380v2 [Gossypium hirsutum]